MTQRVYPVSGLFENISELQPNNIVFVDANGTVSELAVGNNLQVNGGQLDVVLAADVYVAMEGTNIGTGTGVFAVRDGNTLKFKSIQGGSSKVVVTNDAENLYVHVVGVADYTHTHLISDVTGLQTVLDSKTNIGHTHVVADVTNFNSSVNSIIGASSINALSDVFIDTPIINQFLVYDGSQWTNSTISYTFLSLQDTPITYIGQANKLVRVNAAQTGLEFTDSIDIQSINAQTISIQGNDVASSLDNKVDKIVGKGLSTNDYTNYDKGVVDVTDTVNFHSGYSTVLTGGEMTLTGGVNFSISAGTGLVRDALGNLVEISWPELTGSVPQDGVNFVYIGNTGSIFFSTIKENYDDIFIGYIATDVTNTSVLGFNTVKLPYQRFLFHIGQFTENVINVIIEHGAEFTIQSSPNTLNINVSAGTIWSIFNNVAFPQRNTFRKFYKDVNSNYLEETSTTPNAIDNINWNDTSQLEAAAIKPMTAGYYKKDSFFISTRGNVFYEYGMAEYEHYDDALIAPPPVINPISTNVAVIAHVIVQQGNSVPIAVIDVRPMFSKLWNGEQFREFIKTASHHQLNGLEHDDHLQYHTDVRGDVRYYRKTELDSGQLDNRYYTEAEIDALLSTKSNTSHVHDPANNTTNGFMSSTDYIKLSGIETGATANQTDAFLLSRANHTGTQDVSTITGLTKSSIGLGNVDNTSDLDKPISTATQTALDNKVDKIVGKGLSTNDFTDAYQDLADLTEFSLTELGSSINVSGGIVSLTGGVNFSISAGVGYTRNNLGKMVRVTWSTLSGSCTNAGDNFINIDYLGNIVITSSAAQGDLIALGYIRTALSNTVVVGFSNTRLKGYNHLFNLGELFRSSIGTLVQSGCNTAMQPTPNDLKLTVGSGYLWSLFNRFIVADTSTFTKIFNTSDFGFVADTVTTANEVNTIYYNDPTQPAASALVPLSNNHYKKDLIALTPEGTVYYLYATTQWGTLDEARTAPTPAVPENIKLIIARSAAIISRQSDTVISELIDIRPMFSRLFDTGQAATSATVVDHGDLTGLGDDDHLQYHTDARGDARYYRKTELDGGVLDTRYYTESEITTLLSGKANSVHTHVAADITDLSKSSVGLSNVQNVDQTDASNITSGTLANARLTTNLSEIGNIVKSEGDLISVNGGVYTSRTLSQLKTDLSLNNVQNVDQTNASNITSGTLANARLTTNLSQIGTITFNSGDVIYFNGTTLTNRSPSQYKTDLNLTKSDVGLSNVQNVDQTNASNITSGTLANARLTSNLAQIGNITFITNDFIQYNGSSLVNVTPASVKLSLNLTKSDVGLSNVQNVDQTNASNIASGTLANARLTANLAQIGGLSFATNDIITYNGTILTTITPSSYKTLLALTKSDVGLSNVVNSLQVINAGNALSLASGTNASRPTAGTLGRFYYSNDQRIISFDNGTIWDNILPAYTGDVSSSVGGTTLTLATVNSNIGTFNTVTVNGKGLVTAASNANYLVDSGANGVLARTSLNTTVSRTLIGTANQISITDGDGVAANPTIKIADNPVIPGTASITMPSGTTAQRDTPTNGQMRYNTTLGMAEISDNGVYRPFGKVAQIITGNIPQTTGTTILPYDTTAPTNTEGFEIFSTTITPTYNNSNIVVIFNVYAECSSSTNTIVMSLYNNTTSISVVAARPGIANVSSCLGITKNFVSATTAPITLSARVGPSAVSTVYLNRGNTETMGSLTTSYIIMEIV